MKSSTFLEISGWVRSLTSMLYTAAPSISTMRGFFDFMAKYTSAAEKPSTRIGSAIASKKRGLGRST